jgi:hypothetical protein
MKLTIINSRSFTYSGQCTPQGRFFEVRANGQVSVDVNGEIGNAVPMNVWNNEVHRLHIPREYVRSDITAFYLPHRTEFETLVKGMSTVWNGNNYIGTLTSDANEALESLEYALYSE